MIISSRQNPKIKTISGLKLTKNRKIAQKFLVEGYYPLKLALANNFPLE